MENEEKSTAGDCPVCETKTKQDENHIYCGGCGFNINDKDNNPPKPEKTFPVNF